MSDVSHWRLPTDQQGPRVAVEVASRLRAAVAMLLLGTEVFLVTLHYAEYTDTSSLDAYDQPTVYAAERAHGGLFLSRQAARRYVETWRPSPLLRPGTPRFVLSRFDLRRGPRTRPWST